MITTPSGLQYLDTTVGERPGCRRWQAAAPKRSAVSKAKERRPGRPVPARQGRGRTESRWRKRTERRRAEDEILQGPQVAKARKFALESFAESLLPVLDSLEAGLAIQECHAGADPRRCRSHAAPAQERAGTQQGPGDQPGRWREVRPAPPPGHQHGALGTGSQHRGHRAAKGLPASPSACCAQRWSRLRAEIKMT
jgi:hypothetical protein